MNERTALLKQRIQDARSMICFTGAGISTESGIPDFRSPGTGLWQQQKPIPFQDFIADEVIRQESWRRRFEGPAVIERATPNRGHEIMARWVQEGRCRAIVTQNVDGLHQRAGAAAEQVLEVHGNATYARCLSCERRYELAELAEQFRTHGQVAPCEACGGILKTATISFGQAMPSAVMSAAEAHCRAADLCLVAGSSLVVYPAAGLPELAKASGAFLAIINREPTPMDGIADLVIHGELGETLASLVE